MERLTAQWGNNHAVPTKIYLDFMFGLDDDTSQGLTEIFDRLAAYEDTGLEPCDYAAMKAALEQADTAKKDLNELIHIVGAAGVDHLRELVQAEKDGRLVVLPCKVGATVWAITSTANVPGIDAVDAKIDIFECKVESITHYPNGAIQLRLFYQGTFVAWWATASDFGKTVFSTREQAEAALKGDPDAES